MTTRTLQEFVPQEYKSDEALFSVMLSHLSKEDAHALIKRQFAFMAALNYHAVVMQNTAVTAPPRPDTVRETARRLEDYFTGGH